MKLYTIKEMEWNIKSEDIEAVYISRTNLRNVYYVKLYSSLFEIELAEGTFEHFKKEFPEHCLSIEPYVVDMPF